MVKITKNASVYDESSSDIPQGYGIEQHPRDGWYAYRVPEYPGLAISYLKDEQGLDRVFSSRKDALAAIKRSSLKKGDTIRIVGEEYHGQVGELKVIEPNFYGVYLDSVEDIVFFLGDEIKKVCSVAEIQANLIQFFQDVGLYLLKESLYGRVPGIEIKVNMAELPF